MTTEWKDITDPEELFRLKRKGWEIEVQVDAGNDKYCPWKPWKQEIWSFTYLFRARPRQPKMKKVKSLCWIHLHSGAVFYGFKLETADARWIRQPHLDLEGEVPEWNELVRMIYRGT